MKNAEELMAKYHPMCSLHNFKKALSEHDQELISEIEKKIEERKLLHQIFNTEEYNDTKLHDTSPLDVLALTEIINLIKEK